MTASETGLDRSAAVTRASGWGVVAGPFHVAVGLVLTLALTRPGFDLSRHAVSLLTLGDLGGPSRGNPTLTGLMVVAAALGILRAIRNGRGVAIGVLTAVEGVALVLSAMMTASGILHLVSAPWVSLPSPRLPSRTGSSAAAWATRTPARCPSCSAP